MLQMSLLPVVRVQLLEKRRWGQLVIILRIAKTKLVFMVKPLKAIINDNSHSINSVVENGM